MCQRYQAPAAGSPAGPAWTTRLYAGSSRTAASPAATTGSVRATAASASSEAPARSGDVSAASSTVSWPTRPGLVDEQSVVVLDHPHAVGAFPGGHVLGQAPAGPLVEG